MATSTFTQLLSSISHATHPSTFLLIHIQSAFSMALPPEIHLGIPRIVGNVPSRHYCWVVSVAGVKGNGRTDSLAAKATITDVEVLRSLRHCLWAQSQGHHTTDCQEERSIESSFLKGRDGTVRLILEQFQRRCWNFWDRVHMDFPEYLDTILNLTEFCNFNPSNLPFIHLPDVLFTCWYIVPQFPPGEWFLQAVGCHDEDCEQTPRLSGTCLSSHYWLQVHKNLKQEWLLVF